jgi:hypothetical protein
MKLADILRMNCEDGVEPLQRALSKTSWLEKYAEEPSEITMAILESLYKAVVKKYPGGIAYISHSNQTSWAAMIKHNTTHAWIETVFFITFYECLAKTLLVMYGYFVKGIKFKDVPTGKETK